VYQNQNDHSERLMRSGTKGRVQSKLGRRRNDEGFAFLGCGDADGFGVEESGRRCAFFSDS